MNGRRKPILHLEDWVGENGRRNAIVQTNTRNTSFIRMYMRLDKMGIKNNLFHLSLLDPKLLNVHPETLNDENDPTRDLRLRVAVECRWNPWYFFREVCMIPAQGGKPVMFELHRGNLAMLWCFFSNINLTSTQPRQTGKAQPLDAKILTPSGWTTMGAVRVGDLVSTPDGGTARITHLHPQGVKPIYAITLEDGRRTECCMDHLWKVRLCNGPAQIMDLHRLLMLVQMVGDVGAISVPVYVDGAEQYVPVASIASVRDTEAQCITIDHPEHLYITDDYIVTHNSIAAVAICCYVLYIAGCNMEIGMLTLNNKILQANVKRVKDIRNELPSYLIHESPNDNDNKEGLYYAALNTKYLTYAGQKDRRAAGDVGRGASSPFLHVDEPPFIPNIDKTLPTIMASTDAARATAKAAGQYHANIFTTTAGDPTTEEGKYIREYLDKAMRFTEVLYDTKDNEAAHAMVRANSQNQLVDATFSYLQLGRSHAWFKDQISRNNVARSQVERDYLNKWVSLAENPILSKEITDRMYRTKKDDPCYNEVWGDYILKWYVPKQEVLSGYWKTKPLIMGFDGSELIGNDYSTCVAIDPTTLAVIFTFKCNESSIAKFSMFIADILTSYRKLVWVPERKSVAPGMIDTVVEVLLRQGQNPFKRIFNKIVDNRGMEEYAKYDLDDPNLAMQTAPRKSLGFMTTGATRSVLYKQVLQKAADSAADRIYDPSLINELTGLQARNGRLDHKVGGNDDMVIAWLLACYMVFEGKNLSYYGIDPLTILQDVKTPEDVSPYHVADQRELRATIKELAQMARDAADDYRRRMIIYDIERILPRLDANVVINPLSSDSVRQDAYDYRDVVREVEQLKRGTQDSKRVLAMTRTLFGVED